MKEERCLGILSLNFRMYGAPATRSSCGGMYACGRGGAGSQWAEQELQRQLRKLTWLSPAPLDHSCFTPSPPLRLQPTHRFPLVPMLLLPRSSKTSQSLILCTFDPTAISLLEMFCFLSYHITHFSCFSPVSLAAFLTCL